MTKGARPFLDIWAMHQTSAILFVPIHTVIRVLNPNNTGILLIYRQIFVAIQFLSAVFFYRAMIDSGLVKRNALIVAALLESLCPICINTLNYNTASILVIEWIIIQSLKLKNRTSTNQRWTAVSIGYLCAVLVQINPFMIFVALVTLIFYLVDRSNASNFPSLRWPIFGVIAAIGIFLMTCQICGTSIVDIICTINYTLRSPHGTMIAPPGLWETLITYLGIIGTIILFICIALSAAFSALVNHSSRFMNKIHLFKIAIGIVCAFLLVYWTLSCIINYKSEPTKVYVVGPILFFASICSLIYALLDNPKILISYLCVTGYAAFAGSQVSTDQSIQISGFYCAFIVIGCLAEVNQPSYKKKQSDRLDSKRNFYGIPIAAIASLLVFVCCGSRIFGVYRDSNLDQLNIRINSGPAAGIITSDRQAKVYRDTVNVVSISNQNGGESLSVEIYHPIIYLMSQSRPIGYTPGRVEVSSEKLSEWYRKNNCQFADSLILVNNNSLGYQNYSSDDRGGVLGDALAKCYIKTYTNDTLTLYKLK